MGTPGGVACSHSEVNDDDRDGDATDHEVHNDDDTGDRESHGAEHVHHSGGNAGTSDDLVSLVLCLKREGFQWRARLEKCYPTNLF